MPISIPISERIPQQKKGKPNLLLASFSRGSAPKPHGFLFRRFPLFTFHFPLFEHCSVGAHQKESPADFPTSTRIRIFTLLMFSFHWHLLSRVISAYTGYLQGCALMAACTRKNTKTECLRNIPQKFVITDYGWKNI